MDRCTYKSEYYNYSVKRWIDYYCDERAIGEGLCIFHHPDYHTTHQDEITNRVISKFNENEKSQSSVPLLFIDCSIGEFAINSNFQFDLYFIRVNFTGSVDFVVVGLKAYWYLKIALSVVVPYFQHVNSKATLYLVNVYLEK